MKFRNEANVQMNRLCYNPHTNILNLVIFSIAKFHYHALKNNPYFFNHA